MKVRDIYSYPIAVKMSQERNNDAREGHWDGRATRKSRSMTVCRLALRCPAASAKPPLSEEDSSLALNHLSPAHS